ncbi:hypothetical protein [Kineococcus rubinsiae]|uniref:hypothetical protein n=1 Tax=Kineococcus rubinsiae TaxID=2609562 RepID=UPI001430110B|nr:hypothetical protein [Kineococcus rubinsiae]NIZ90893.1 hypothetical protein [Kineococcus rubinsiae]
MTRTPVISTPVISTPVISSSGARRPVLTAARVAGGLAAALALTLAGPPARAATTVPPVPLVERAQRSTPVLTVRAVCGVDGATLSVSWRRPGTAERYDVVADHDGETYLTPVGEVGTVQAAVRLTEPVGTTTVRLLERPTGTEVAQRTVRTTPCDGWSDAANFTASGSNAPGQPQSIGDLAATPTTDPDGTRTWAAEFGRLVVGPDALGHVVRGPVADYWAAAGGPAGRLGRPTGSAVGTQDGLATFTTFANARVWSTSTTGTHAVGGNLAVVAYLQNSRRLMPFDVPGYPTADPEPLGPGTIRQRFERGWYYQGVSGTFVYDSAVAQRWFSSGAERGPLGWPRTDTEPFALARTAEGKPGDTWRQRFDAGTLYAPMDGSRPARLVGGAIAERYQGPYWSDEVTVHRLGLPVTDELATPDGVGRYNHFAAAASIYWTQATGAHVVADQGVGPDSPWQLRSYWAAHGWERGVLGYPTTEAVSVTSGGRSALLQRFTGGVLCASTASTATGEVARLATVRGAFRTAWEAAGSEASALGMPTAEEVGVPGGTRQVFAGGELRLDAATGRVTQVLTP